MASVGTIKYKNGSSWIDILHPVNSFYFSYAPTSPSSLFGGTWTQVTDAAIRGNTSVGYVGSDTHILTVNEMPSHRHNWTAYNNGQKIPAQPYTSPQNFVGSETTWTGESFIGYTGGGQHTQSCNAPSTAISGIALRKSKRVM